MAAHEAPQGVTLPKMADGRTRIVGVFLNPANVMARKNFRCISCGRIVFQYFSKVKLIFDGAPEVFQSPIDLICVRCKMVYRVL